MLSILISHCFHCYQWQSFGSESEELAPSFERKHKKRDAQKKIPVPRKIVAHRKSYLIRLFRNFLRYRKSGNLIWTEIQLITLEIMYSGHLLLGIFPELKVIILDNLGKFGTFFYIIRTYTEKFEWALTPTKSVIRFGQDFASLLKSKSF